MTLPFVIRTKLQPPVLATDLVPRRRLLDQLKGGSNRPFTLVCAPPGYGKTTLIGAWPRVGERDVAWLSLDQPDSDLDVFLAHLVSSLQGVVPGGFRETESLSGAANGGTSIADRLRSSPPFATHDAIRFRGRQFADTLQEMLRNMPCWRGIRVRTSSASPRQEREGFGIRLRSA